MDASRIQRLFGDDVAVEVGVPGSVEGALFPEEEALLARAVEKRRREFTAGRVLARSALARVGAPEGPLLANGRAPIWPEGFAGSITHTRTFCAVVAARRARMGPLSLGIDAEEARALSDELLPRICNERERAWLAARSAHERGILGKLFFSAKEAFYKCQSPLTGRFLGFEDVDLELDLATGRFSVIVHAEENALPSELELDCRFELTDDLILATARTDRREP